MNSKKFRIRSGALAPVVLGLSLALGACSDDEAPQSGGQPSPPAQSSAPQPAFDHHHGKEVSDLVKHKFEHDFAEQCVARETKNSNNPDIDRQRFEQPCMCISEYLLKGLTAKEAELFLEEHKDTQSLRIRYEAAAYNCLQKNAQGQDNAVPVIVPRQ